jgi:hypothetical protein
VDAISEPLGLVVAYDTFTEPAPYDPAEIVQSPSTVRCVDRLLNLLSEHASALGCEAAREGARKPDMPIPLPESRESG